MLKIPYSGKSTGTAERAKEPVRKLCSRLTREVVDTINTTGATVPEGDYLSGYTRTPLKTGLWKILKHGIVREDRSMIRDIYAGEMLIPYVQPDARQWESAVLDYHN